MTLNFVENYAALMNNPILAEKRMINQDDKPTVL